MEGGHEEDAKATISTPDGQETDDVGNMVKFNNSNNNRRGNRFARRNTPYPHQNSRIAGGAIASVGMPHNNYSDDKSRRIYVGNLSWDVTWRELKDHMKTTGFEVTRADVLKTPDGRSKGCGIVEFAETDGARKAVLTLNDTDLMGRQIFVREDREDAGEKGGDGDVMSNADTLENGGGSGSGWVQAQSRRVYVGNLSWDVAWQDLKDRMRNAGDVVFAQVMTEPDGRSKGCGIVEYQTAEEAQEAINTLTDSELKGRMIFVREDREITGATCTGVASGRGSRGNSQSSSCSVYVGNLSYDTAWQDLKDHMRQAGNVNQANVLTTDNGRSKGCGIVLYQKPQEAARAIRELQNSDLNGRPIFVREDRETPSGPSHDNGGGGVAFRGRDGVDGGGSGSQLFVGNLSWDVDWRALKDHFSPYGDVDRADVGQGPDGRSKGFGTVRFFKAEEAQKAISTLNGSNLLGRNIEVRLDHKA
jgi:RNA recognition motif-containing protein